MNPAHWWSQVYAWTSHHLDWGDVPTSLAFIGAVAAAYYTKSVLEVERSRDRQAAQQQKRAQADQVSAWLVTDDATKDLDITHPACKLANSSGQPVYRVRVIAQLTDGRDCSIVLRQVLPPNREESVTALIGVARLLPENAHPILHESDWREILSNVTVSVLFKDAAGTGWLRGYDGEMEELSETHFNDRAERADAALMALRPGDPQ